MKLELLTLPSTWGLLLALLQIVQVTTAIDLDVNSDASIKKAAKTAAKGMVKYYTGNEPGDVPGNLPEPYYWWEAGAMFGALIDYWYFTEDDQYNDITTQALLHQASPTENFMPDNQSRTLGNDDQAFWGMAVMSAAERKFPDPPDDKPGWLALAQAVFNSQAVRWNTDTCGGGLKWQIFPLNRGYDYKNSISNGGFMNIASRLARYTHNDTYAHHAEKTWDWSSDIGMLTDKYEVYDGMNDEKLNCTEYNKIQWTYNAGIYLHAAANMYNYTDGSELWKKRVQGLVDSLHTFFYKDTNIMFEVACENIGTCKVDQRSFKAYLARWMAATTQLAPFVADTLMTKLGATAEAAAKSCSGGDDGSTCGLVWTEGKFDGSEGGVGEQMAALEVFQSNLIKTAGPPVTNSTGGTSQGNPGGGLDNADESPEPLSPITTADKAGAGILTVLVLGALGAGTYWGVME